MRKELQNKLYKDFPGLYRQHVLSGRETRMCDGFACGDGWFDIIYQLSKDIVAADPEAQASQVKEKFGELRFYLDSKVDEVHELTFKAMEKSQRTCENCGVDLPEQEPQVEKFLNPKLGILVTIPKDDEGWIWTVCSEECKEKLRKWTG